MKNLTCGQYALSWYATQYAWKKLVNTPWLPLWLPWLPPLETPALKWLDTMHPGSPSAAPERVCCQGPDAAHAHKARKIEGRRLQPPTAAAFFVLQVLDGYALAKGAKPCTAGYMVAT